MASAYSTPPRLGPHSKQRELSATAICGLTLRIFLWYYQLRMTPQRSDTRLTAASSEKAARRLWPQFRVGNGLDPLRTHAVAAAVAAATGRVHLLADILNDAQDRRLDRVALEESLLQVYLFAGYPRAIEALTKLSELWPRMKSAPHVPASEWNESGEELCRRVYGRNFAKLHQNISEAHPDLAAWMVSEGYGKVLSRPGLDSISRELCTVGALIAMDTPRQLQAHILGARNVGASAQQIEHAVDIGRLGCGPRVWQRGRKLFLNLAGSG